MRGWPTHPLLELTATAKERRLFRPVQLDHLPGVRAHLRMVLATRLIQRVVRGVYAPPGLQPDPLAVVAIRSPASVVCLFSALHFHGFEPAPPRSIWISVRRGRRAPRIPELPIRAVTVSPSTQYLGVALHRLDGVDVPICSVARAVVDCFKYPVPRQFARAALEWALRERRCTLDELRRLGDACRVPPALLLPAPPSPHTPAPKSPLGPPPGVHP